MNNPTLAFWKFPRPRSQQIRAVARERGVSDALLDVALRSGHTVEDFRAMARRMEVQRYCEEHGQVMVDATTLQMLEAMAERSVVPAADDARDELEQLLDEGRA